MLTKPNSKSKSIQIFENNNNNNNQQENSFNNDNQHQYLPSTFTLSIRFSDTGEIIEIQNVSRFWTIGDVARKVMRIRQQIAERKLGLPGCYFPEEQEQFLLELKEKNPKLKNPSGTILTDFSVTSDSADFYKQFYYESQQRKRASQQQQQHQPKTKANATSWDTTYSSVFRRTSNCCGNDSSSYYSPGSGASTMGESAESSSWSPPKASSSAMNSKKCASSAVTSGIRLSRRGGLLFNDPHQTLKSLGIVTDGVQLDAERVQNLIFGRAIVKRM